MQVGSQPEADAEDAISDWPAGSSRMRTPEAARFLALSFYGSSGMTAKPCDTMAAS